MKRIIKGLLLLGITITFLTGCIKRDDMENITIYTTIYPIEYITNTLYGDYATIKSIYPSGIDVYNYELTDKQIDDYSSCNLFIYNGLSDEKMVARNFINKNKKINLIDVSYGLNVEYGSNSEELWLSPNNFLMLATTLKNNLEDMITSKYIKEKIESNYTNLQEEVSKIDANLRTIGDSAEDKGKETIIVTNNSLKFLENYGFKVISIEDDSNYTQELKNNFKNGKYTYLFIKEGETSDKIDELVNTYKAQTIEVNTMEVLSDENKKNNENYISITNNFLKQLSDATLG